MTIRPKFHPVIVLITLLVSATAVAGEIERAVSKLDAGHVTFRFAAHEDVWGNGQNICFGEPDQDWNDTDWRPNRDTWQNGPVHVALDVHAGEVRDIDVRVGSGWRRSSNDITDLGDIAPCSAARFLLDLARNNMRGVGEDAIMPATLADGCEVWPELLEMARDREVDDETREQCVFWLGQLAGEKITRDLVDIVGDDEETVEIREQALFAISQRDKDVAIPALTRVSRTSRHSELREQALFWLGQIDDERVLELFEEILLAE